MGSKEKSSKIDRLALYYILICRYVRSAQHTIGIIDVGGQGYRGENTIQRVHGILLHR